MKLSPGITLFIFLSLLGSTAQAQNLTEKSVEGNVNNLPVREYTLSQVTSD
jgi:hypothetical protein